MCREHEPSYEALIARGRNDPPKSFFWGPKEQAAGQEATKAMLDTHKALAERDVDLDDGRLHPHTELRNVPHA